MQGWFAGGVFAGAALLLLGGVLAAQQPQSSAAPANLKVLAKSTSLAEVYTQMAKMQRDLGVSCSFCHDENPETKQLDYSSDDNPRKETARLMMRMTNTINEKYLSTLAPGQEAPSVTCGNCHLGQMHPPAYEAARKEAR